MNPKLVWPAVVLACVGLVVAGVMAAMHVDKDTIVLLCSLLPVPVLTALVAGQLGEQKGTLGVIQTNVNGNWTRMLAIVEAQGRMLAAAHPVTDPGAYTPPATADSAPVNAEPQPAPVAVVTSVPAA